MVPPDHKVGKKFLPNADALSSGDKHACKAEQNEHRRPGRGLYLKTDLELILFLCSHYYAWSARRISVAFESVLFLLPPCLPLTPSSFPSPPSTSPLPLLLSHRPQAPYTPFSSNDHALPVCISYPGGLADRHPFLACLSSNPLSVALSFPCSSGSLRLDSVR